MKQGHWNLRNTDIFRDRYYPTRPMMTKSRFGYAALCMAVGVLAGALSYHAWFRANGERNGQRILNNLHSELVPILSKETYLLMELAGGIEARSPSDTRRYICRLIDMKIREMKAATQQLSMPYARQQEEELRAMYAASIPSIDQVINLAHCPPDSLPNSAPASRVATPDTGLKQ